MKPDRFFFRATFLERVVCLASSLSSMALAETPQDLVLVLNTTLQVLLLLP